MESVPKHSDCKTGHIAEAHGGGPNGGKRKPVFPLEVSNVVQYGTGRGSRMDLTVTVVASRRRVRLRGFPPSSS